MMALQVNRLRADERERSDGPEYWQEYPDRAPARVPASCSRLWTLGAVVLVVASFSSTAAIIIYHTVAIDYNLASETF